MTWELSLERNVRARVNNNPLDSNRISAYDGEALLLEIYRMENGKETCIYKKILIGSGTPSEEAL